MNQSNLLVSAALAALVLFVGCKKESGSGEEPVPEEPIITFTVNGMENPDQLTADVGDTLKISAEVSAGAGIESFTASYSLDEDQVSIDTYQPDTLVTAYSMSEFELLIDFTFAGDSLGFVFSLSDTLGASIESTFSLLVNESPIRVDSQRVVSPYNQQFEGNLYNVMDSVAYFPLNVKSDLNNQKRVDFIVAYDRQAGYIMSSPGDADADTIWNHNLSFDWPFLEINNTQFIELDPASVDFDEVVTAQQLVDLFSGASVTALSGLYKGQIISLRLDNSERGGRVALIKITNIIGDSKSERQITFDIKIEQ